MSKTKTVIARQDYSWDYIINKRKMQRNYQVSSKRENFSCPRGYKVFSDRTGTYFGMQNRAPMVAKAIGVFNDFYDVVNGWDD